MCTESSLLVKLTIVNVSQTQQEHVNKVLEFQDI